MADLFFGGGLNQRDEFNVSIEECVDGQNFILDAQAKTFRPRLPFDLKGTATNGAPISGIMQLIKRDDTDTLLVTAGNQVYQVNDAFAFSDVGDINTSTGIRSSYWSLDDRLVITDLSLNNVLHKWDGSTFTKNGHGIGTGTITTASGITRSGSTATLTLTAHGFSDNDLIDVQGADQTEYNSEFQITNTTANTFDYTVTGTPTTPATGTVTVEKSVDLYAKYSIEHNGRVWLFNIKDVGSVTSENPHMILVSEFEEPDKFDIATRAGTATATGLTGNEAFFLLTPDLRPINGVAKFFNTLLFSTIDGELFRLTGSDATDYQIVPFYAGSAATGTETLVNVGNDVHYMKRGGDIDSLSSTDQFGDVAADDLSRFIRNETSGLSDAISVYHQNKQYVYYFVTGKVLVLDKNMLVERPDLSPWSVFKTEHSNSFNTQAATYIRDPNNTTYDVYWGDSSGNLFKMNGTAGNGDAGSFNLLTFRKTRYIREIPANFINLLGKVEYRRRGQADLIVTITFGESGVNSSMNVPLRDTGTTGTPNFWDGDAYWGGEHYWDEGEVVEDVLSTKGFSPAGKGDGFFLETRLNTQVNFLINRLML